MKIKILGPGCTKCENLEREVKNVLAELNIPADVEKVEDTNKILEYDVFMTPALMIDDKVKISGKVPRQDQIKTWLREAK